MNKKITEAIDFVESAGLRGAVFAIPFPVGLKDVIALRDLPICKGLVLRNLSPDITATSTSEWLGCFDSYGWRLPTTRDPIVFVGAHLMLTRRMATQVVKTRRLSIVCKVNGAYRRLPLHRFLLWRIGGKLFRSINQRPQNHPLRKFVGIAKNIPLFRKLWRRTFKQEELSGPSNPVGSARRRGLVLDEEAVYRELLMKAHECAGSTGYRPIPRRVLLVNAGLAAGGAERQIVNTLIGLRDSKQCESVGLLAEYIDCVPHLDFFLRELETAGISVSQVEYVISLIGDGLSSVSPEVAESLADISPVLIEEVLNLVEEFRSRKPEVVHAWQDATSIKVGIAAVIAGVPRIVLAGRNMIPTNFTYYQDYMRPAYRALAELENVKFINNSEAGALDYAQWLALPRERFSVVRNGVDLSYLLRPGLEEVGRYRDALEIPRSARVVGSVFRFWPEKRPMLWLEAALQIARRFSDVHFLIIGEGPLRPQMERFIQQNRLVGRVHLPGARPDVAPALSAMDIFLLTSGFEGTPNVVLEAQWLGLPIVATDSGGTCESFADGETGLLAMQSEPSEVARSVGLLLNDQSLMTACAHKSKEFVASKFGLHQMIHETLSLYGFSGSSGHSAESERGTCVETI